MNLTKGSHQNIPPGEGACMDTLESLAFAFKCTRRMSVFKFAVGIVEMISSTHSQLFQDHAQLETLTIYGHVNIITICNQNGVA